MSQIVIDTDAIKKAILYFFVIVGVLAIVSMMVIGIVNHFSIQPAQPATDPVAAPGTASAPAVTLPAQQYPYVTEFTVLSTTVANGFYEAVATSGQIFNLPNFNTWNSLWPQHTYTATITGAEANGALDVGTVNRLSAPIFALTGGVQTSQNPYVIEFTVLSTTIVNGNYEVLTTDGRILYFTDFTPWNSMYPRETYTGTVIGIEANGAYDIGTVNLIAPAFSSYRGFYPRDMHFVYDYYPGYRPPIHPSPYDPPTPTPTPTPTPPPTPTPTPTPTPPPTPDPHVAPTTHIPYFAG